MSNWRARAECRDADPEAAFQLTGSDKEAEFKRDYCRPCPVKTECLEFGLRFASAGVWGGLNPHQWGRKFGKAPEPPAPPPTPPCGSVKGYRHHRDERGEDACPACKRAWTEYCNERRAIRKRRAA